MQLAPVVKRTYTDEERAVIAGFLLRQRAGTLKALSSSDRYALITTDYGSVNQQRYYRDCEQYSRFLLAKISYPVAKGAMYAGT